MTADLSGLEQQPPAPQQFTPGKAATPAPQEFDPDERRTCRECSRFDHYRRWCLNPRNAGLNGPAIAAAIAHLPQRCPGFAENPNREEPEHD